MTTGRRSRWPRRELVRGHGNVGLVTLSLAAQKCESLADVDQPGDDRGGGLRLIVVIPRPGRGEAEPSAGSPSGLAQCCGMSGRTRL